MIRGLKLRHIVLCFLGLLLAAALSGPDSALAQVTRGFTSRFSANANGEIVLVGNTLMTCPATGPLATTCTNAQGGGSFNNNDFNMVYVDVDSDSTTFNSSSATLQAIPPTATVLFAGLYWTADASKGTNGSVAPDVSKRNQVLFSTPAGGSATTITATQLDDSTSPPSDYGAFRDVTTIVQAAGGGVYTVANVQAGTGTDRQAGWALVVVIRNPDLPLRNLTVFDGFVSVSSSHKNDSFTVSGFLTPAFGTVVTRLGVVSTEGDLALLNDSLSLNNTKLGNQLNPTTNFFNSTISDLGAYVTTKTPDYKNQLGFDIDKVDASGILANNATSATISLTTDQDAYQPMVVTFETDLFAPNVSAVKTVTDVNGGDVVPGDLLRYSVTVSNTGVDAATAVVLDDPIPGFTTYSPNSLVLDGTPKTDGSDGDEARFDAAGNQVLFNLGTLNPGAQRTIQFTVHVDDDAPDQQAIRNRAHVTFRQAVVTQEITISSNGADVVAVNRADLRIVKTTNPAQLVVGATATYTLTVSNAGPLPATGRVVDHLPEGLAFVSATPSSGGSCNAPIGRVLICQTGLLPVGGSATIQIVMTAIEAGTVENTAGVDTVEPNRVDPDLSNNSSSVQSFVDSAADLAITKTQSAASVRLGDTLTYTLKVTNSGPSAATGVVVTDALPPGRVTVESVSTSQGNCANAIPVKCTLGRIEVGASATITLVVRTTSAGVLPNAADVTAIEHDPNTDNNTATTGALVVPPTQPSTPPADVSVVKTTHPSVVTVGQQVTYQIVVTNNGPSPATGIIVSEVIPDGVTLVSATPTQGSCGPGQQFSCQLGSLNVGAKATVDVVVAATRAGTFSNLATAIANEPDPDPTNNVATVSGSATGNADLAVVKQAAPNPATLGDTLEYRVSIRNNGPAEATNVLFEDRLPDGVTLLDVRSSQGTCTVTNIISCSLGTLANGASARVGITVRVDRKGKLLNAARATADQPDPDGNNNVDVNIVDASAAIEPASAPDLTLTKTASASTVQVGGNVTYTITATNTSPNQATGVLVTDVLPQGAVLVSATPSQGTCTGTGIIECSLGTLAGGGTATVTVVVQATAAGPFDNFASVQANESDPALENNEATVPGTVETPAEPTPTPTPTLTPTATPTPSGPTPTPTPTPPGPTATPSPPNLTITKVASNSKPFVGDPITFTITITNISTNVANGVTLTDPLPPVLLLVSATPSQGSCDGGTPLVCQLGTVTAGQSVTVQIVANTTVASLVTNTAIVSATGTSNKEASATVEPVDSRPPQDPDNDKDHEREAERREREEHHQKDQEEQETQGNVVAVACTERTPRPPEPVAGDDGLDMPYVVIVTVDGNQKVRLVGRYARLACPSIQIGDYLEANGEKQHEYLFDADDVKVRGARP